MVFSFVNNLESVPAGYGQQGKTVSMTITLFTLLIDGKQASGLWTSQERLENYVANYGHIDERLRFATSIEIVPLAVDRRTILELADTIDS